MTLSTYTSSTYFKEKIKSLSEEKRKYYIKLGQTVDKTLNKIKFYSKKKEGSIIYIFQSPIIQASTLEILSTGKEIENYINFAIQKQTNIGNKIFLKRFNDMINDFFYVLSSNEKTQVRYAVDNSPHVLKHAQDQSLSFSSKYKI